MKDEFNKTGAKILIILGDSPDHARRYAETLETPFPVLSGPERVIHRYELEKNFIGIQRTASVIVNENGEILYIKRSINHLLWLQESQELIRAVQS